MIERYWLPKIGDWRERLRRPRHALDPASFVPPEAFVAIEEEGAR
jgi:hypothetical protein